MSKVEVKVNYAGVGQLLKSSEAAEVCASLTDAAAAHFGYTVKSVDEPYNGATRVNIGVVAK